jgi:hypothetical protein
MIDICQHVRVISGVRLQNLDRLMIKGLHSMNLTIDG